MWPIAETARVSSFHKQRSTAWQHVRKIAVTPKILGFNGRSRPPSTANNIGRTQRSTIWSTVVGVADSFHHHHNQKRPRLRLRGQYLDASMSTQVSRIRMCVWYCSRRSPFFWRCGSTAGNDANLADDEPARVQGRLVSTKPCLYYHLVTSP